MDVAGIQNKLNAANYPVGAADGALGPNTYAGIMNYVANRHAGSIAVALGQAANADFAKYQINTPLRMAHFLAQGCEETQYWQFFTELGDANYFAKYDTMPGLGNTQPGDGFKYRGRGIFMITGRYNYTQYAQKTGLDLVNHPELAADPVNAMTIACIFWNAHGCSALADNDDCLDITKKINGGTNGLSVRQALTTKLKALFGV